MNRLLNDSGNIEYVTILINGKLQTQREVITRITKGSIGPYPMGDGRARMDDCI